ncbi:MAG: phytanoyl-CoA dioxygenase family protein [Caldimonas sp.]
MAAAVAALIRGAVPAAQARAWLAEVDAHPAWQRDGGNAANFNAHSSSLRLDAVDRFDVKSIATALVADEVGAVCRAHLGSELACDIDQCWIRRQYAPDRYPLGHAPHSWHQDGALGFDFLADAGPLPRAALISMLTCWIALTPCGEDAPGLEFVDHEFDALLPLASLTDNAVRASHDESKFVRPMLQPGDALVFGGGVLHHTHVRDGMHLDRTSVELRFFAAGRIPERLRHDRFHNPISTPETCR